MGVSITASDDETAHRQIGLGITGRSLDKWRSTGCLRGSNNLVPNIDSQ